MMLAFLTKPETPPPEPREPVRQVRCADCLQLIDPVTRAGHHPWCPFDGYVDFPRAKA